MLAPSRRWASLAYVATLAGTLISVFVFKLALLSLLFILLQALALTWYILSYVPYGQAAAKKLVKVVLKKVGLLPKGGHAVSPITPAASV